MQAIVDVHRGPSDSGRERRGEKCRRIADIDPPTRVRIIALSPGDKTVFRGQPVAVSLLTVDPALNMQLGTAYLQAMLDRFGGSLPLAFAAYNAGPNRVDTWLADNGDPRPNGGDADSKAQKQMTEAGKALGVGVAQHGE